MRPVDTDADFAILLLRSGKFFSVSVLLNMVLLDFESIKRRTYGKRYAIETITTTMAM